MRWLLWNDQYIKSSSNIFWSFGGFVWLLLLQGSVHKWRHPHIGGRVSANRWRYSVSLFSKIGDKDEGGVKNLKKWVMSFMDGPQVETTRKIIMLEEVTWINICFALSSSLYIREWTSTKLVEYELLRVSNSWV